MFYEFYFSILQRIKVEKLDRLYPDQAFPVRLDFTDETSIKEAVHKTMDHFGGIDVLVNNAGYCYRSSVEESEEDEIMKMFQTNLFGLITLTKEVSPLGIRVIVVEPGAFRTNFFSTSLRSAQMKIKDYQDTA